MTSYYIFAVTPKAPTIRGGNQVDEGTNLTLTCEYPNVATIPGNKTYTWTGFSNPPSPSSSNNYTQNMALDDAGQYTCNIQIDGHTSPDSAIFNVTGNLLYCLFEYWVLMNFERDIMTIIIVECRTTKCL